MMSSKSLIYNKRSLYVFMLIVGIMLLIAGVGFNPYFVVRYLSPDGVLGKSTVLRIYTLNVLTVGFGLIFCLYSIAKISNSSFSNKIDGVLSFSRIKIPNLIKIFFLADLMFAITHAIFNVLLDLLYQILDLLYPKGFESGIILSFISRIFDLNNERSMPTWYSSIKMFLIGMLLATFAYYMFKRKNKASWILLFVSIPFFGLSIDEIVGIHEWLGFRVDAIFLSGGRGGSIFRRTGVWIFVLGPIFLVLMFFLGKAAKQYWQNRPHVSIKYLIGLMVLIGSATGIELVSNFVPRGVAYDLQVICEELGEMIGGTILL